MSYCGGEYYSRIDKKNACNQFILSDEPQDYTTINTSKGLFKYTLLVYGLANAPALFQKVIETLLSGIDGVSYLLHDICITDPDKTTHLTRLRKVLSSSASWRPLSGCAARAGGGLGSYGRAPACIRLEVTHK